MEKIINAFMDEFQKNIPPALYELKEVINAHVRSSAETIIRKMDLVTREEFDTQLLVLRRAQEKLVKIEKSVKDMQQITSASEKKDKRMKKSLQQTSQSVEKTSSKKTNATKLTKKEAVTSRSSGSGKVTGSENTRVPKRKVATKKVVRKKTTDDTVN